MLAKKKIMIMKVIVIRGSRWLSVSSWCILMFRSKISRGLNNFFEREYSTRAWPEHVKFLLHTLTNKIIKQVKQQKKFRHIMLNFFLFLLLSCILDKGQFYSFSRFAIKHLAFDTSWLLQTC